MYRYALINKQTNIVDNTVVWDGTDCWTPPDTHTAVNIENTKAGVNWKYENGTFTAPVRTETTPVTPTLEQLQAQLLTITAQMQALANTANT